ncbi:MAG: flagellar biosynthetic protein FliQ [Planctomycetota bacterium]|jgi:flagellar biosynthetic protein FliQ
MDFDLRILDYMRDLFVTALTISGPVLLTGLVVGVAVSLFQALTSVQEQTLSMIPKMFAAIAMILLLLAPALGILRDFALRIFGDLNVFGLS